MPDLPQFEANRADRGLQTNNIGMEAFAQEGRRVGAFYHQIGADVGGTVKELGDQWQDHVTFQQISNGMAEDAQNYNQAMQAWGQMLKDPSIDKNDPSLAQKAVEQFKSYQDEMAQHFTTPKAREWYMEHSAQQLDKFQETIIGQQSQFAGLAALQNDDKMVGAYAQAAYTDPTQVSSIFGKVDLAHEALTSSGAVNAETAMRFSEITKEDKVKIADGGARGAIYNSADPVAALNQYMQDPKIQEVVGDKMGEYTRMAEEVQRSRAYDQRAAQEQQTQQEKTQWQMTAAAEVAKGFQPDGSWTPPADYFTTIQKLAQTPGADLAYVDTLMNRGQEALKAHIDNTYTASDPGVYANFTRRLGIAPGTPGALTKPEIVEAGAKHLLSDHDVRTFTEGVDHVANDPGRAQAWGMVNKVTESFKSTFTKSSPLSNVVDFSGDQAYGRFQAATYDLWQAELQGGKSAAQAEQDMTDPKSVNYVGRLVAKIGVPTAAQHQQDIQRWGGGGGGPNPLAMP